LQKREKYQNTKESEIVSVRNKLTVYSVNLPTETKAAKSGVSEKSEKRKQKQSLRNTNT
jgi:hypothetical protein